HPQVHGDDDGLLAADAVRDLLDGQDRHAGDGHPDGLARHLRQGRRGGAGADVADLAERVELHRVEVLEVGGCHRRRRLVGGAGGLGAHAATPLRSWRAPTSTIRATEPSPRIVAPATPRTSPRYSGRCLMTMSCWPTSWSTTTPRR